jgi:protein TonB
MRTYTLAFSIVVHLLAVMGIVLTPLIANDMLPEPRRAFEFIIVRPVVPPSPPPPPKRDSGHRAQPTKANVAPIVPPDTITPEPAIDFDTADRGDAQGVPGGFPVDDVTALLIADPPPPPPPPPTPRAPLRIGGVVSAPQKIRHVAPIYPAIAQSAGVQGVVILEAVLGEDGRVRNLRVLRSVRLLDQAAIDAVRQWQFTPTLLNGQPVPVVMTVTVSFGLTPH